MSTTSAGSRYRITSWRRARQKSVTHNAHAAAIPASSAPPAASPPAVMARAHKLAVGVSSNGPVAYHAILLWQRASATMQPLEQRASAQRARANRRVACSRAERRPQWLTARRGGTSTIATGCVAAPVRRHRRKMAARGAPLWRRKRKFVQDVLPLQREAAELRKRVAAEAPPKGSDPLGQDELIGRASVRGVRALGRGARSSQPPRGRAGVARAGHALRRAPTLAGHAQGARRVQL
jgi:hypothetical protein